MKIHALLLTTLLLSACGSDAPNAAFQFPDEYGTPSDTLPTDGSVRADRYGGNDLAPGVDTVPGVDTPIAKDTAPGPDTPGPDTGCVPQCAGLECGDDSCGGSCGSCGPAVQCISGTCVPPCEHPNCALGKVCENELGDLALCGGTLDFEQDLDGKPLSPNTNVETLFGQAGVLLYTDNPNSVAATNNYVVKSVSKGNSCASLDQWGQPWLDNLILQFVLPEGGNYIQGSTHFVSLYIALTWPGGIRVDFYAPGVTPGEGNPFHQQVTQQDGHAYVEFLSPEPIGWVVVMKAQDQDFTIDDFSFGSITFE